jgi:predicted anti-sigma-YlaC factor YlaD
MICREVTEFLMDYESRSLAPAVHQEFELHLARCADCRIFLVQYQETVKAGKHACAEEAADAATEMPDELLRAIMTAIRAAKGKV